MCGISGALALGGSSIAVDELVPVNDAMRLRGPDDAGFFCDGRVALGHRRLSIIDLSGGHQPMSTADDRLHIVFNGEIYNFAALRDELVARGYVFRTKSDTEVILHGYDAWGDAVVDHIDGMFAFALWDAPKRRMLLARDRFGKKPLFFFETPRRFVFASTLSALLQHPEAPRKISSTSLARYLWLEFAPIPDSMVEGIRKLPAGTSLAIDGAKRTQSTFFRLAVRGGAPISWEDAAEGIRTRLIAAVQKRILASDVPLGVFLSGGIDSSAVVAAAAQGGAARLKTFSIGFSDPSFDESRYARIVAERYATEHVEEVLSPDDMLAIVPELGHVLDEPMADASIVPTYFLSRLARRYVTVALGGDGGDELFAGYPTYTAHRLLGLFGAGGESLARLAQPLLRRLVHALPVSHRNLSFDFLLKKMVDGLAYPREVRNYAWLGAVAPEELPEMLGHAVDQEALFAPVVEAYRDAVGDDPLERVLSQDVVLYMQQQILVKVDRASMANSLEVRAPFLDTELATFIGRLPVAYKLRGLEKKALLKHALAPWLPHEILYRKKKGFGMPIGPWLRGPLRALGEELLVGANGIGSTGWVDRGTVARLWREHQEGRVDHRKRLWALLVLELWRRAQRVV